MMAFSDYDRDGDLDGYLLTNRIPPGEELKDVRFRLVKGPDGEPVILPEEMQQYAGLIKSPSGYKQIASDNSIGSIETMAESLLKWEKRLASENLNMVCLRLGGTTMPTDGPTSMSLMIFMELITFTAIKAMALLKMCT